MNHAVSFFLPDHILNKKIEEGTKEEKEAAIKNLKISQMLRGHRSVNALSFRMTGCTPREASRNL
jgi:hypothetical protein